MPNVTDTSIGVTLTSLDRSMGSNPNQGLPGYYNQSKKQHRSLPASLQLRHHNCGKTLPSGCSVSIGPAVVSAHWDSSPQTWLPFSL